MFNDYITLNYILLWLFCQYDIFHILGAEYENIEHFSAGL